VGLREGPGSLVARITDNFTVRGNGQENRFGRTCVTLVEPIEYHVGSDDSLEVIIVPAGFETDFASIPWGLWNLFPPLGPWARPAIVHDFLYATSGTGLFDGSRWITRETDYSRSDADGVFREALAVVGVPGWRRTVMYRAVRLGGASGWKARGGPPAPSTAEPRKA
jgi:hypothetical protein